MSSIFLRLLGIVAVEGSTTDLVRLAKIRIDMTRMDWGLIAFTCRQLDNEPTWWQVSRGGLKYIDQNPARDLLITRRTHGPKGSRGGIYQPHHFPTSCSHRTTRSTLVMFRSTHVIVEEKADKNVTTTTATPPEHLLGRSVSTLC